VKRDRDDAVDAVEKIRCGKTGKPQSKIKCQALLPAVLYVVEHGADRGVEIEKRIRAIEREIETVPALTGTERSVHGAAGTGITIAVVFNQGDFALAAEPPFIPRTGLVAHDAESRKKVVGGSLQKIKGGALHGMNGSPFSMLSDACP
jgi:hypothetical protein